MSAATEDRRLWLGGGVGVGVLVLLGGWLLLVHPQLSATADIRAQAEDAQVQNSTLAGKVSTLKAADRNLPVLVSQLRRTREQLPITSGLATFTDQLGTQAAAAKVTITTVGVGAASAVTAAVAAPAVAATGTGTAGVSESAPAAATTTATGPAGQLYQVQLTLITTGGLLQQRDFLTAVQAQGPRAALVTSVQLAPATDAVATTTTGSGAVRVPSIDTSAAMTTVLTIFVSPQTPAATQQLAAQLAARPQS